MLLQIPPENWIPISCQIKTASIKLWLPSLYKINNKDKETIIIKNLPGTGTQPPDFCCSFSDLE